MKFFLLLFAISAAAGERLSLMDLNLWKQVGSAEWRLEEGVIHGGQDGDPRRSGRLATVARFADFELELEFLIDEHGKYNSGVYLRKGYQLNIGRGAAGEYIGLYKKEWLDKGDEKDEIRKPREWNRLRIQAVGPHIRVWLNGQQIVDYAEASEDANVIALQTYGAEGHAGWVKFRKVWITDLSDVVLLSKDSGRHTATTWPEAGLSLRLYVNGLEGFRATAGDRTLSLSVLSHSGRRQLQSLIEKGKERELPADSPLRATIKLGPGFFDVRIPQAFLDGQEKVDLSWIDFYR